MPQTTPALFTSIREAQRPLHRVLTALRASPHARLIATIKAQCDLFRPLFQPLKPED